MSKVYFYFLFLVKIQAMLFVCLFTYLFFIFCNSKRGKTILLLGVSPGEMKIYPQKNLYTNVSSRILKWKQLICPSANEWINNFWYIHTMEYNLVIKKKKKENADICYNMHKL